MLTRTTFALFLFCSLKIAAQSDYLPYGVMRVNEKLVADQTEILVQEWLGYIVSVCDTDKLRSQRPQRKMSEADKEYLKNFHYPDSLLPAQSILETLEWRSLIDSSGKNRLLKIHGANWKQTIPVSAYCFSSDEKMELIHHWLMLPVTGISYKQAQAFCRWRTEIDSLYSASDWGFPHYVFRLPTIFEFCAMNEECDSTIIEYRRSNNLAHPRYGPVGFNYRNVSMQYLSVLSKQNDLHESWEFDSDMLGLYAIQGNAAEMTSRKGAACGGSYFHYARESYRYEIQTYEHAERWLGFRCVAEVR